MPDAAAYVVAGFTTTPYTYRAFGNIVPQVVSATSVIACLCESIFVFTIPRINDV